MRALLLLCAAAFDYKSISVNAPRRIVTQDDIDAKFEEVDKPYALYPVDGPAEEGLCVLAEISLDAPGFSWRRDNYIIELLDDQAEPFATVSTSAQNKYRGASRPRLDHDLHTIDATPARWRGGVGLTPLDWVITAASPQRNDLSEELSGAPDSPFDFHTGPSTL